MHNNSFSIRDKVIEYFRNQVDLHISLGHYGNALFLLEKLSHWSDSVEMDVISIKQDLFPIISCLVPFDWLSNPGDMVTVETISQCSNNDKNIVLDEFFLPSYFDRISKISLRLIKNIILKQINSTKESTSPVKNSISISDFLHWILLLLEISLFHVHASITSESCCHASAFANKFCNISSESLMIELKSALLLLLSAVTEYRCDCMEFLQYSSHEQLRLSASLQAAEIIDSHSSIYPQSMRTRGVEENIKPLFSGLLLSGDLEELAACIMRLLDTCDTVVHVAVALLQAGPIKGQKFERETVDSIHTSVLIDMAKFWNNQSNHPSVDCLTAGAMLCSLPRRREEAARPYIYSSSAKGALKSELTSAGLTAVISVAMRLADRFQPQYQVFALELLLRAVENTPASIAQSFCSWIVPKIIVYLKAFSEEKSIVLASRFVQVMLSTSSIKSSPSTIVPLCHEYLNHSMRFMQISSLTNRWSYLTHFKIIFPWISVGFIDCHLDRIMLILLTQLNAWHYPIHVICMEIFQVLVRRVPQGMSMYSMKLTVELIRMQVFYNRGEYDVSSFFQQQEGEDSHPNLATNNSSSSSNPNLSIRDGMLRATVVLAKELRRMNVRQWDETASAMILHSRGTLTSPANSSTSSKSDNSSSRSSSSSSGGGGGGRSRSRTSGEDSSSSIHAVSKILTNFCSQVQIDE